MNLIRVDNYQEIRDFSCEKMTIMDIRGHIPFNGFFFIEISEKNLLYLIDDFDFMVKFEVFEIKRNTENPLIQIGEFSYWFDEERLENHKISEYGEELMLQNFLLPKSLFYMLFRTLGYIDVKSQERARKEVKQVSHRPKYSREHRLSTSKNKIYLLDDIITYASEKHVPESGHSEYTCPCWEVRGHYRHYKNGNVIFIKSYKKGKEKDKTEPISHEYRLERGQK